VDGDLRNSIKLFTDIVTSKLNPDTSQKLQFNPSIQHRLLLLWTT
jgi:hypothetical protein